ncbi:MAG: HAD-IB family phosphatase [Gemmatimonadaceae bacterium]|nr:HAD-IB family phosphatase [Gemmatimonadaceae bacterium]
MIRFKTAFIDVDSTLCGIEGIDWLASQRSESFRQQVAELTERAMDGETSLESVYAKRLALVAPTRAEVAALAREYSRTVSAGALATLKKLKDAGVDVHLISGGLLPAIREMANELGFEPSQVHAVDITFTDDGAYSSFDASSPLTTQSGKRVLIDSLSFERPAVIVGDGMTDAEARPAVDAFIAYTGHIRRDAAVSRADHVVTSFAELQPYFDR